jgi:hypothetical protein
MAARSACRAWSGQGRALEMVMTGRTVNAEEALAIGLVNRIVQAPGLAAAKAYAREFSGHGLRALQFAREAVQRALDVPLHEGLRVEADLSTLAYRTRDAEEGHAGLCRETKGGVSAMNERECIVVTGASRGIGAAIALALAQQGRHVACVSRSGALPAVPARRPKPPARWIGLKGDVTDPESLARPSRSWRTKAGASPGW